MTFSKMGFRYTDEDIEAIINCKPLAIENALRILKVKIEMYIRQKYDKKGNQHALNLQANSGGNMNQPGMMQPHPVKNDSELPQINPKGGAKPKSQFCRK